MSGFFPNISRRFPPIRDEIGEGDSKASPGYAYGKLADSESGPATAIGEMRGVAPPRGGCADRGAAVIRQAISCDICGNEKKQTNHWFVAYDQGGELRVSGWNSRNRLRPGSKHLCGQTCLHKLVDEFMARALAVRAATSPVEEHEHEQVHVETRAAATDTSLTSDAAYEDVESSARLIPTPVASVPAAIHTAHRAPVELVAVPARARSEEIAPPVDDTPRFASRNWRADAWEREREREARSGERRPEVAARRRFS